MYGCCLHPPATPRNLMAISPATRDRLTSSVAQLVRTGRHVSTRAAAQLYGELPSFGWALLLPLERDGGQRCSTLAATRALRQEWALGALASWDEDDARTLSDLLDRLVADLETAGTPRAGAARVPAPR